MTKRLQVLLDDDEFEEVQEAARKCRATLSDFVRQALREARRQASGRNVAEKLEALARAAQCNHPAPPIEQMLEEIERGYHT